jgi:hypothetical protein
VSFLQHIRDHSCFGLDPWLAFGQGLNEKLTGGDRVMSVSNSGKPLVELNMGALLGFDLLVAVNDGDKEDMSRLLSKRGEVPPVVSPSETDMCRLFSKRGENQAF